MAINDVGQIRPGQVITTYGPGAIMDTVNDSLMILDIDYWDNAPEKIYDKRLAQFLNKNYFKKIPDRGKMDLPTIPFPNYHVCSNNKCRRLFDIRDNFIMSEYLKKGPTCPDCGWKAYPARFVVSCSNNHLDDFPWRWWAHGKKQKACKGRLRLTSSGNSSSLSSMGVECECGEKWHSLAGSTLSKSFEGLNCTGNHPHRLNENEPCNMSIIPLQRGASNVYFPALRSAISIPDKEEEKINLFSEKEQKLKEIEEDYGEDGLKKYYSRHFCPLGLFKDEKEFIDKWIRFKYKDNEAIDRYNQIKQIEYESFTGFDKYIRNKDFEAEEEVVPNDLSPFFSRIVRIHRLKEILVLLGFMRNESPEPEVRELPHIKWLGSSRNHNRRIEWLPAIEVYGEGIFLEFNKHSIAEWFKKNKEVQQQSEKVRTLYNEWLEAKGWSNQTEKDGVYVMLHTFAHLLIKQLADESGYSSASIKERIYYGDQMAGILIYTGSTDQEGTLGGLVEMGEIERLRKLISQALEGATFCASDPDCSMRELSEENQLNGSACLACSMLAETACETGNRLLDRTLVVPTMDSENIAFFKGLI